MANLNQPGPSRLTHGDNPLTVWATETDRSSREPPYSRATQGAIEEAGGRVRFGDIIAETHQMKVASTYPMETRE